jgi:serine/threonine protein kinase
MKIYVLVQAQILTRIHHKNLVSMIGYCKDGEYMALVYEHMSEGNLEDKLRGSCESRQMPESFEILGNSSF